MKRYAALVVLSGGQDSTTTLFWAKTLFEKVHAITFDYGQKHVCELLAARRIAALTNIDSHEVVEVGAGLLKSTSPLVDKSAKLEQYSSFSEMDQIIGDRIEKTFVPMRNALFLVLAANRAVTLGCDTIVTGVCQQDNANYPDCRASFVASMQTTINLALGNDLHGKSELSVSAPLINLSKAQTIDLAVRTGAYNAYAYTHTAYDGVYPPTGSDHASLLRAYGFEQAGLPDPLVVRAWHEKLMPLPDSDNYKDPQQLEEIIQYVDFADAKLRSINLA